ncbi:MAG TPA: hypothetical protein DCR28_00780 [Eubacterium sp.]|nr:hypothetical protein [Eubacterium sp.]
MRKILSEQFWNLFRVIALVIIIGICCGGIFVIEDVSAAPSSPIKVQYDGKTRHNIKIEVGKATTNYVSYTLTDKGKINSATWSSSNKTIMQITTTAGKNGTSKCKFKGIKEGHAVLKLTVKTTKNKKNYTYTESVGISVYTNIKDMYCVSYAIPETYIYRGATTEQFEVDPGIGSEYRKKAFFNIQYQCGGYYYVQKVCEPIWSNGSIVKTITNPSLMNNIYTDGTVSGFVKKSHVSTSISDLIYGIELTSTYQNYPLNYEKKLVASTTPVDIPVTFKWSSSNSSVVEVSNDGVMKTRDSGNATITVWYGNFEIKRNIRVTGLLEYDAQNKKTIINDNLETVIRELGKHISYSNLLPTDDVPYDVAFDIKADPCALCNTKDRYFESFDIFNTNCYGYVVNRWGFCPDGNDQYGGVGFTPGIVSGTYDNEMFDCAGNIAELVKNDVEYMGGEAVILEGSDNNSNYPVDENHYLIAIRTNGAYYSHLYDYHFMIKRNDEWYFKDGLKGDILKLKNYQAPDSVLWNAEYKDYGDGYMAGSLGRYVGQTQYMVISKLPISITQSDY